MILAARFFFALIGFCLLCVEAGASVLSLENRTGREIINIFVTCQKPSRDFFLRLDLLPGASDSVENPDCVASLRADTGLEFWEYANVDLASASRLTFAGEQPDCLASGSDGQVKARVPAVTRKLAPQPGDRPVCSLEMFRPAMPMREVCDILPGEMPRDDNGALLAGLGFAGMTWAARLVPDSSGPVSDASILDHLALRRPLDLADLGKLLAALGRQDFIPWQADFPGLEVNTGNDGMARADAEVLQMAADFLKMRDQGGHGDHAAGDRCPEASIIMAPRSRLAELENSDEPARDVQIFTIYLQPCTNTLLLDMAAYRRG